jgi:hypothetical protein
MQVVVEVVKHLMCLKVNNQVELVVAVMALLILMALVGMDLQILAVALVVDQMHLAVMMAVGELVVQA